MKRRRPTIPKDRDPSAFPRPTFTKPIDVVTAEDKEYEEQALLNGMKDAADEYERKRSESQSGS